MDARTGKLIGRDEHIPQSIRILLKTAEGTRVMKRELGVDFLDEKGRPLPDLTSQAVTASAQAALTEWEPRIVVESIHPTFEEGALKSILVAYRDKEAEGLRDVTVSY